MNYLCKNIVWLRKKLGYTQKKVADLIDLKVQTYQAYEENRSMPTVETALKICALYNVSVEDMVKVNFSSAGYKSRKNLDDIELCTKVKTLENKVQQAVQLLLK